MSDEQRWYEELAGALDSRKVDRARTDEIVTEARAHCEATGERPQDAFGSARTYATHLTSIDDPEEARFRNTAERHTWVNQPAAFRLLFWTGVSLAGIAGGGWLLIGRSYPLTAVDLLIWFMYLAWMGLFYLRMDARRAGRPSTGRRYMFAGLVILAAGIWVGGYLPISELGRVPFSSLVIAGLVMVAAGWWLGDRWEKAHPPATHLPSDVWLDRLAGLLEGRYRLPAAKAREFRAEAESHLVESGGDPAREFGPVDDYAAELAERSGLYPKPEGWPARIGLAVLTVFFGSGTVYAIADFGILDPRPIIPGACTLLFAGRLVWIVLKERRRTPQASRR